MEKLEFGNLAHIKIAKEGYRKAEMIESGKKVVILEKSETTTCDQCNGEGEWEDDLYECPECGNQEADFRSRLYEITDGVARCKVCFIEFLL